MRLAAAMLLAMALPAQAGCGDDPDPCEVPLGRYHIALPDTPAADHAAVMFLHGAGGSGRGALSAGGLSEVALGRGVAVIGPDGMEREGRFGSGWYFHPDRPKQRDEVAFLRQVADDAAARFGIDRNRILLAGFSIGGSMTSYAACADPGAFAAYAPVAGSFWRPHPESCAAPVRLFHTHGWRDTTVPLEGRPLRGGTILQGDVWHAMEIWRDTNGCTLLRPDGFDTVGNFWLRRWTECTPESALDFALHPGAHGVPKGWAAMALDWFDRFD